VYVYTERVCSLQCIVAGVSHTRSRAGVLVLQERAELRRRARLEEEAAAARRSKVTVTLDLLGRKVLTTDGPQGAAGAAGGSGSSFELGGEASATQQLLQQVQAAAGRENRGSGSKADSSAANSSEVAGSTASKVGGSLGG